MSKELTRWRLSMWILRYFEWRQDPVPARHLGSFGVFSGLFILMDSMLVGLMFIPYHFHRDRVRSGMRTSAA